MEFNAQQDLFWEDCSPVLIFDLVQIAEQIIPWTRESNSLAAGGVLLPLLRINYK